MATTKVGIAPMKAVHVPKPKAPFQIVEREIFGVEKRKGIGHSETDGIAGAIRALLGCGNSLRGIRTIKTRTGASTIGYASFVWI